MTATTDRAALYAGILERPDDDVARLVYADWLEENGEAERAEFIRRQIAGENVKPSIHWFPMPAKWFTFSRGFASTVSCDLQSWVGGPCPCVNGHDYDSNGERTIPWCKACAGTGRTPGHGPRIVTEQPVQEVRTEAVADPIGDEWCWVKDRPGLTGGARVLPEVFDLLEGGRLESGGNEWQDHFGVEDFWRIYPTEAAAQSALSLALVNWARREAGLPPLREHATA